MAEAKRVSDSRSIQTQLLMPVHMNDAGVLFGGQLLSWIDALAGVVSLRHTDLKTVTVAIDHLDFKRSARSSDVLTLDGRVTWVGKTSLEVRVDTWRENKGGKRELINEAFLVMVALDDDTKRPTAVPGLILETDEERAEWAAAEKRADLRKLRRKENF